MFGYETKLKATLFTHPQRHGLQVGFLKAAGSGKFKRGDNPNIGGRK